MEGYNLCREKSDKLGWGGAMTQIYHIMILVKERVVRREDGMPSRK